jgi:hypothetical protein
MQVGNRAKGNCEKQGSRAPKERPKSHGQVRKRGESRASPFYDKRGSRRVKSLSAGFRSFFRLTGFAENATINRKNNEMHGVGK